MNLIPRVLSDEEYESLKKKLHHTHDTIIKVTLHEEEAIRELLSKIIMPLLGGIKLDLDKLKLDTTSYIRPNLQVFFQMWSIRRHLLTRIKMFQNLWTSLF